MPMTKLAESLEPVEPPQRTAASVVFQGFISDASVDELLADLNDSLSKGVTEIKVSFTTPGGEVDAGLRLYGELRKIAGKARLTTHAFQLVASMGVAVYLAGDERTIGPKAQLMLHATSSRFEAGQQLTASQLRLLAEQMDGRDGRERKIIVERTGLPVDDVVALVEGEGQGETWLTAREAVDKGFSTSISELLFVQGWYSELGPYPQPESS